MRIRSFLAAFGLLALLFGFAYSVWAEAGPYAWVAAALVALTGGLSPKLTFVVTLLGFLVPAGFVMRAAKGLPRWATFVFLGIPGVAVAVHFALTIVFMATGGTTIEGTSFREQIAATGYLPRNVVVAAANLPRADVDHAISVGPPGSDDPGEIYIPFERDPSNPLDLPVILKTRRALLQAGRDTLGGSIRRAPIPYLVRHARADSSAAFAIIIADDESVRSYWLLPAIFYGLVIGWVAYRLTRRRVTPSPATAACPAPPPPDPVARL